MPAFWAGLQAPGAAPQQPVPPATQQQQQGQSTTTNTPTTSFQNLAAGGVPLFPPPFPSMVPLPPFPTPPPNLTELSEEELRAMEGNLRQAVEARMQTLQRIQLLLDAASAMMNQYQTAAATAKFVYILYLIIVIQLLNDFIETHNYFNIHGYSIPVPTATSNVNVASDVSSLAQPGTSKNTNSEVENIHSESKVDINVPTTTTTPSESTSTLSGTDDNDVAPESSVSNETEPTTVTEILRRRRLQKFSTQLTTE